MDARAGWRFEETCSAAVAVCSVSVVPVRASCPACETPVVGGLEPAPPEPPDIPVPSPELEAFCEVSLPELATLSPDIAVAPELAEALALSDAGYGSGVAVAPAVDPDCAVPLPAA